MVEFKKAGVAKKPAPAAKQSLRDKYKATSIAEIKSKAEEEDREIGTGGGRPGYLEITDQLTNKFRLYPSHTGGVFMIPVTKAWLTIEKDGGEEGRTTVFHGVRHGYLKKDPIDAYIETCQALLKGTPNAEKLKKLVSDYKAKEDGLSFNTTWIAYADKIKADGTKDFGLVELKKTVRDALNSQAALEAEDQEITIDPYTGPDDGKPILIKYNKKAKKASDYYKVQVSSKLLALTEDELEAFDSKTPLDDMFGKIYTERDFDTALEGLRHFDEANEMEVFESQEFQDIIEDLRNQIDEGDNEPEETTKSKAKTPAPAAAKKSAKKVVEEELEEEEEIEEDEVEEELEEEEVEFSDPLTGLTRDELKAFIKENGLTEEIKIFKNDTEETLCEKIRAIVSFGEEEVEEEVEEELVEEEEIEEEEEETPFIEEPKKTAKPAAKKAVEVAKPTTNPAVEKLRARLKENSGK